MTTEPDIKAETTDDLIYRLGYQSSPGVHTFGPAECGPDHWSRGCASYCSRCIDEELLRRGIDVTKGGTRYVYERNEAGRLVRKQKGSAGG